MGFVEEFMNNYETVHEVVEGTYAWYGIREIGLIAWGFMAPGEKAAQYGEQVIVAEFFHPWWKTIQNPDTAYM